jgi:hypothetical protein
VYWLPLAIGGTFKKTNITSDRTERGAHDSFGIVRDWTLRICSTVAHTTLFGGVLLSNIEHVNAPYKAFIESAEHRLIGLLSACGALILMIPVSCFFVLCRLLSRRIPRNVLRRSRISKNNTEN